MLLLRSLSLSYFAVLENISRVINFLRILEARVTPEDFISSSLIPKSFKSIIALDRYLLPFTRTVFIRKDVFWVYISVRPF
jgi:hypothetical protein